MEEFIIRPYRNEDRDFIRKIAYDTALLGDSASAFFDDQEIVEDFLTAYFIDYEPQSCFVAETNIRVIGYIMGVRNSSVIRIKPLFKLLLKAIAHNLMFKKKNVIFIFNYLKSFFKGEFKSADFSKDYPATLHINIEEDFRNQGIGTKLIAVYLDYLAKQKIKGVHFATLSDKAAHFYDKLDFVLLDKRKRSYLKHILQRDIFCYIYGRKLIV